MFGSTKKAERYSWLVPRSALQDVWKVRELAHTRDHWALPVPFQLPQTGTAREDRQGVAASLPPRAGNISLCSTDGNGAQVFVTVIQIREAAFLQLGFSTKHDSTTGNALSKIFRRFDFIFY